MPRNLVARQLLRLFRLVEDPAPQLGGDLQSNGSDIDMADDDLIWLGTDNDGTFGYSASTNTLVFQAQASGSANITLQARGILRLIADNSDDLRILFGTEAAGDLFYNTNANGTLARLPIGAAGRVLQVNSGATAPEWSAGVQSWAPTLQAGTTNPTLGTDSDVSGGYVVTDGWCHYWVRWRFGTASVAAGSGPYFFTLPVAPHASLVASGTTYEGATVGHGGARDNSTTGSSTVCRLQLTSGSNVQFHSVAGVTFWTNAAPWTWAASDRISVAGSYPVA